jgi:hypothetical protein
MAKNTVDSIVRLEDVTPVRKEGTLVSVTEKLITFKNRKPGGSRTQTRSYPRSKVMAYGEDFIVVKEYAAVSSKLFRQISGAVSEDKFGFYNVDGIFINPEFGSVMAEESGNGGGAAKKAAPKDGAKKKAKK